MKDQQSIKKIALGSTIAFTILFNNLSFAISGGLPGSVEPGVLSRTYSAPPITPPPIRAAAITHPPEQPSGALGPQAEKIKFKLNRIVLEGNKVYSDKELSALYKSKIGKLISVAELVQIVQDITNYYRNNGFILSRAVLPPQHVANGVVHIQILEGYIDQVKVLGNARGAKYILLAYGNRISESKPLQIKVMEKYLRLANEVPGVKVRAVLEPSKTKVAASNVGLAVDENIVNGYLSYDDYGTRYIGPNQVTGNFNTNSIFRSGDSTHVTIVRTSRPLQLQYFDIAHDTPFGSSGMRGSIDANSSRTLPGLNLQPIRIDGDAVNFVGTLTMPILRTRDQDLSFDAAFSYMDSLVRTLGQQLYNDHLRTLKAGLSYDFSDRFRGSNFMSGHIEYGTGLFGASIGPTSFNFSRFGADGHFTKFYASAGRTQQLFWRLSAFFYGSGQYSYSPLLAGEQFAYGGSQLGRGYDPAEIIGDRGAGGSAELRLDATPGWKLLQTFQPYAFYDSGVIWNLRNIPGSKRKQSAGSTGLGIRFTFTKNLFGNLMLAQPITRQVAAEAVGHGNGRQLRGFFSITLSG